MAHRRVRRPVLAAIFLLGLGVLLVGCGGGDNASTTSSRSTTPTTTATAAAADAHAERAIRATVARAFTSNDPAGCVERATSEFIRDLYGGSIAKCRRQTKREPPAHSVRITDVTVADDVAHARAEPQGGENDGQGFALTLAMDGGRWKLDSARYLYGSDPKTDGQVDESLRTLGGKTVTEHLGVPMAGCARERLLVAFKSAGVPLSPDENTREATAVILGCLRDHPSAAGFITGRFLNEIRRTTKKKLGAVVAACLIDKLRDESVTAQEIVEAINGGLPSSLKQKLESAGEKCGATAAILKSLQTSEAS